MRTPAPKRIVPRPCAPGDSHLYIAVARIFVPIKNKNTAGMPAVFLVQHFRMDQKS
jgi:hypothetical protein